MSISICGLLLALLPFAINGDGSDSVNSNNQNMVLIINGDLQLFQTHYSHSEFYNTQFSYEPAETRNIIKFRGGVGCMDKSAFSPTVPPVPIMNSVEKVIFHKDLSSGAYSRSEIQPFGGQSGGQFEAQMNTSPNEKGAQLYLMIHHNCTDDGISTTTRFNITDFQGKKYRATVEGMEVFHVADSAFETQLQNLRFSYQSGRTSDSIKIPKALYVQGSFGRKPFLLTGKLYNWDFDTLPDTFSKQYPPNEANVPRIYFDGKITAWEPRMSSLYGEIDKNDAECNDVKLTIRLGDKTILHGSTLPDGTFHLSSSDGDGQFLDVILPEALVLEIEHKCGKKKLAYFDDPQNVYGIPVKEVFKWKSEPLEGYSALNMKLVFDSSSNSV